MREFLEAFVLSALDDLGLHLRRTLVDEPALQAASVQVGDEGVVAQVSYFTAAVRMAATSAWLAGRGLRSTANLR